MNYFEYFSEIETHFSARRGSLLLLSPLDWALIETWREAEVPLAAVLRGIDTAFDKYEARRSRSKGRLARVNGLAWCAQAVLEAAAATADSRIGAHQPEAEARTTGFETERVARFLSATADSLTTPVDPASAEIHHTTAQRLHQLAAEVRAGAHPALDQLDRTLTVLEGRLHAALLAQLPESELQIAHAAAEAELAPFRARLGAVQIRQLREQLVQRHLFQQHRLPRLSLFYMPVDTGEEDTSVPDRTEPPRNPAA